MDPNYQPQMAGGGEWKQGLFGCFSNPSVCLITWFCPCVTYGKNQAVLGKDCMIFGAIYALALYTFPLVLCLLEGIEREKVRAMFQIEGSLFNDICISAFCGWCVLCQDASQLNSFDASAAAQGGQFQTMPQQGMQYNPQQDMIRQ